MLEKFFESALWSSRLFVLLPVVFSLLSALILFCVASVDIVSAMGLTWEAYFGHHPEHFHEELVGLIIGAVDLYLIAVVMLIFSFGLYELFISKIDAAEDTEVSSGVLKIHSLDQLKDKLAKVIIMVLVVNFFQRIMHMEFHNALEMLYLGLAILGLSLALYFLHKSSSH